VHYRQVNAMEKEFRMSSRALKARVHQMLKRADWDNALAEFAAFQGRQVIGHLFSQFYQVDEQARWRAISAMGRVVTRMAETGDMESARIVMRRLMWHLNDESGGIGWGAPEALGEIMACHGRLADEFHRILISYAMVEGNFLEHEMLQRGVLWGIGRLAHARPDLMGPALPHLLPFFHSPDPFHRGLAAWATRPIADSHALDLIGQLSGDTDELLFYRDGTLYRRSVAEMAAASV